MIGKAPVSLVIEIYIAAVAERTGEFVFDVVLFTRALGGNQVVVPLVSLH